MDCRTLDVTAVFGGASNSPTLKRILQGGGRVHCVVAEGVAGLVGFEPYPGIRLGKELAEIARTNSLGGVIHSDEFRKQGLSEAEETALRTRAAAKQTDALVLVAGDGARAATVAGLVKERLEAAVAGVPRETRSATDEGETRFMRPRPGAARMYPETDVPEIVVDEDWAARVVRSIPVPWEEKVASYVKRYDLNRELALQLYDSDRAPLFERLATELKLERSVMASILLELPVRLSREGADESRLSDEVLTDVLRRIEGGSFAKEAAPEVLRCIGTGAARNVDEAVSTLGITPMSDGDLEKIVDEVVERNRKLIDERGDRAFSAVMGEVMKVARGKVDGAKVSSLIRQRMRPKERSS